MMRFWSVRLGSFALAFLALFLINLVARGALNDFQVRLIMLAGIFVTLAVSLNLINGITGLFSLGHIAFYAIGAYTAAATSKYLAPALHLGAVPTICLSMLLGLVLAGVAGLVVGLPSLRLRGDYLAIVTLGVGEIVRIFVQNQDALGRSYGIGVNPKAAIIPLSLGLAALTVAVCRNLQVSAKGLNFLSVREDEIAAAAMGVNVTRTKVQAFVIGSAFAGAAGAIAAHNEGFISPSLYTMDYSILIVTMVVLGGTGSITGSIVAAIALFSIPEAMRSFPGTSLASVISILLGVIAATALLRTVRARMPGKSRALINTGVLVLCVVGGFFLTAILRQIPALQGLVEGNKLRQVIPAITLVVMMLLRPQGIFGHAEFGWHTLFGRTRPESGPGGTPDDRGDGSGLSTESEREDHRRRRSGTPRGHRAHPPRNEESHHQIWWTRRGQRRLVNH
ncbi:MAG: hypothetical protein C4320_01860 [Armatimonadota bacterium]